ncbi:hypothetical protein T265_05177 [Opisthorchis viverrini]|uniref:Uncharacterized protein n=1 Tax=Opisthorchis viverrini TaxID=6198 RepID=A0A074ZKN9_OPIVI|nr:hypothetical protein T265_05177 [Opisthorchis viverrini]KER27898.1 hypothetical protein T265_05177 [Opisthorchis viverrini]
MTCHPKEAQGLGYGQVGQAETGEAGIQRSGSNHRLSGGSGTVLEDDSVIGSPVFDCGTVPSDSIDKLDEGWACPICSETAAGEARKDDNLCVSHVKAGLSSPGRRRPRSPSCSTSVRTALSNMVSSQSGMHLIVVKSIASQPSTTTFSCNSSG